MLKSVASLLALVGAVLPCTGGTAVVRLVNGVALAVDPRPDATVDAVAVAFAWWPGVWTFGWGEREALCAAVEERLAQSTGDGTAACEFACFARPDTVEIRGLGPVGSAPALAEAIASAIATRVPPQAVVAGARELARRDRVGCAPRELAATQMVACLFPSAPLAPPPWVAAQRAASLDATALDVLRRRHLVGARCAVAAVGGPSVAEAGERIGTVLAGLAAGSPEQVPAFPPLPGSPDGAVFYAGESAWIGMGFRTPGLGAPEMPALLVLARLVGDGNGGLLFRRLRGELDLAYTVGADLGWCRPSGYIAFWCCCTPSEAGRVRSEMARVIESLRGGPPEDSLSRAKERALFELAVTRHQASLWAPELARQLALGLSADLDRYVSVAVSAVTGRDIARIAQTWLRHPLTVIGNPGAASSRPTPVE